MRLYRVVARNFIAGLICEDGKCVRWAPIIQKWVWSSEIKTIDNLRKRFEVTLIDEAP